MANVPPHAQAAVRGQATAANNRRKQRQDEAREKLDLTKMLNDLEKLVEKLDKIDRLLKREQKKMSTPQVATVKVRVIGLKLQADIIFRKLAKVLPDLKAIELLDENGNNPLAGLIDAIMKNQKQNS